MKISNIFSNIFTRSSNRNSNQIYNQVELILNHINKTYPIEKNPIVLSIINQKANTISTLGLDLYQRSSAGAYKTYNNPIGMLLNHPNNEDSATQFLYRVSSDYFTYGNVYIRNIGNVYLQILDPLHMTVTRSSIQPYNKIYTYDGTTYSDSQILHIYNPQYYDGTIGHSPIEYNRDIIELHNALLFYMNTYFKNSAGNRVTLTMDKEVASSLSDEKQKKAFEEWLDSKIQNPSTSGSPILIRPGLTLGEIKQSSNAEADLNTLIGAVSLQICQLFNFPNYMLTGSYGNNLAYQQINYLQTSIMPVTEIFKEKFNELLLLKDKQYMYFDFDYNNLLMVDTEVKHKILRQDLAGGLITLNEARRELNKDLYSGDVNAIEDALLIPVNVVPALNKYLDAYFAAAQKKNTLLKNPLEDDNTDTSTDTSTK